MQTRSNVSAVIVLPIPTTDQMFESLHVSKGNSYVTTWGQMIGKYAAHTKDCVEALKYLRGKDYSRTKSSNIIWKMSENVEFDFGDDSSRIDGCPDIQ